MFSIFGINKDSSEKKASIHKLPYVTKSVCPECQKLLLATVYAKNNKVYLKRKCEEHGVFDELYWGSKKDFTNALKFEVKNKARDKTEGKGEEKECPSNCGLCSNHRTTTALANIVVTNRCDLSCWYCFFYAKKDDPIYEPSLRQIDKMLLNLKKQQPLTANAVQFTGGEPTLRKDIVKIIALAKKRGFEHIQLNTHGINLALKKGFAKKLAKAGATILYLSFDGVTFKTNPKNHFEIPRILDECRKAGLGIVLVPTLIKGVNDHELGAMINFALKNIDVVRGINFQPVSFVGRMPKSLRDKQRITIPDALGLIEKQTKKVLMKKDFFSVPSISPVVDYLSESTDLKLFALQTHFACGTASYLFMVDNKPVALPHFFKVEEFFKLLEQKTLRIRKAPKLLKHQVSFLELLKLFIELPQFIDVSKAPKDINFISVLIGFFFFSNYSTLLEFHKKALFVGMMHFMDLYNYDQERVQSCQIHYLVPDGRIIPFCSFNVFPKNYRDKIQAEFSIPWKEWRKTHPKDDPMKKYMRNANELMSEEIYKTTYAP